MTPSAIVGPGQNGSFIATSTVLLETFYHASSRFGSENEVGSVVGARGEYNALVTSVWLVCPVVWTGIVCCVRPVVSKEQDSTRYNS